VRQDCGQSGGRNGERVLGGRIRFGGRRALFALLGLVVLAAVAGSAAFLISAGRDDGSDNATPSATTTTSASPAPTREPAPAPVLPADNADAPPPAAAGLAAALRGPLADKRLGGRITARVVDVLTGRVLLDHAGTHLATPASTTKLLTATAVLATEPADFRFETTVVTGSRSGEVVLVGGGDPTLAQSSRPTYAGAASIAQLARSVKARTTRPITRVVVDGNRFTGSSIGPGWDSDDVSGGYVAPITAAMVDGGRLKPGLTARSSSPDLAAGQALAKALGAPNAVVSRGAAPAHARTLGVVHSAPLTTIVAQTLTESDNTLAEFLARQVAVATHQPASFAGAAAAVRRTLVKLGVPAAGVLLHDDSGLSRDNRISPAALTQTLRIAASSRHPALHALFAGMPVGGYAGTLADRYHDAGSRAGAGYVRAKTGTLSSVSSLAGVVQDRSGRLLAFALMADQVSATGTLAAEDALDAVAARLAGCGCR
jgi:D-alanyl-D-alanine carboxypeptidase/D-alanyl-D-alanine-endopeptidase (penicillin-binding protein 4)